MDVSPLSAADRGHSIRRRIRARDVRVRSRQFMCTTLAATAARTAPDEIDSLSTGAYRPLVTRQIEWHADRVSRFLTLADVGDILNISAAQAYALVRSGDLPAIKVGGRGQWRIEASELEKYIERMYVATAESVRLNQA